MLIHCDDPTQGSKLADYRDTINLLLVIDAPLKLVIAGNHDFSLETPTFESQIAEVPGGAEPAVVKCEYGAFGDASALFERDEVKAADMVSLDESSRRFKLAGGAVLAVFASPFTPEFGEWAFYYTAHEGHDWHMPQNIDVIVTYGLLYGILARTESKACAGEEALFAAITYIQPKMHYFGHIHRRRYKKIALPNGRTAGTKWRRILRPSILTNQNRSKIWSESRAASTIRFAQGDTTKTEEVRPIQGDWLCSHHGTTRDDIDNTFC